MRVILLLFFLAKFNLPGFGQTISYSIPKGYENVINKKDFKHIVDLSVSLVAKRYDIDFVKNGEIQLKDGQDMESFNLHNLISKCVVVKDRLQWKMIIQDHFEKMFASIDEHKNIDPSNYETVKKYLSLRIYPVEIVQERGGISSLVVKTDLEGTFTILMLDLPGAFSPVPKEMFGLWKMDTAAVFQVAQENINGQQVEKQTQIFDIGGIEVEASFLSNEDYAASYALDLLKNAPDLVGEWGSVVSMPNKAVVNICKISKDKPVDYVKFIQLTKPLIEKWFAEHEQPVSDQFYWYYQQKFTRIKIVTDTNGRINVVSPFGLTKLMAENK